MIMIIPQIRYLLAVVVMGSNVVVQAQDGQGDITAAESEKWFTPVENGFKRVKKVATEECFTARNLQKLSDFSYLAAFTAYLAYCAKNDISPVSQPGFIKALTFAVGGIIARRLFADLANLNCLHALSPLSEEDMITGQPCCCTQADIIPADTTTPSDVVQQEQQSESVAAEVVAPCIDQTESASSSLETVACEETKVDEIPSSREKDETEICTEEDKDKSTCVEIL